MFRFRISSLPKRQQVFKLFSTKNSQREVLVQSNEWLTNYWHIINNVFTYIQGDNKFEQLANNKQVDSQNWLANLHKYRRVLVKQPDILLQSDDFQPILGYLDKIRYEPNSKEALKNCADFLGNAILTRLDEDLKEVIKANKILNEASDLRSPHELYPYARLMKRKIIYHGGPTNSGKTYQAIQRLKQADPSQGGGLYVGPLRLLALEICDNLNKSGIYCHLLTGQEKKIVPGATHTSSTIEMLSTSIEYDVAVIDEIQMIGDTNRGFAWTRALLGLRAKEIHVCGGLEAFEVVKSLCETSGDEFIFNKYERLSTLEIENESLKGDYSKVQPGDCVVAFSVLDLFSIKRIIEANTKYKCAIVYGQLPPETRTEQARLFNDRDSGYDILVASDAIGMGLNLNIRRVIFHSTLKAFTTHDSHYIDPSSIKQIAGRAGRKSSNYPVGKVTTWQEIDLAYVRAVMNMDIPQISSVGIFPSIDYLRIFHENISKTLTKKEDFQTDDVEQDILDTNNIEKTDSIEQAQLTEEVKPIEVESTPSLSDIQLSSILIQFDKLSKVDSRFFICNYDAMKSLANFLHSIPMDIDDRFIFASAPVNFRNTVAVHALYRFAATYANKLPVKLGITVQNHPPRDFFAFMGFLEKIAVLDLYIWLSLKYPIYFVDQIKAYTIREFCIKCIQSSLVRISGSKEYNYKMNYLRVREMNEKVSPLPPLAYGNKLRDDTLSYLNLIDQKDYFHHKVLVDDHTEENLNKRVDHHRGPHNQKHTRFDRDRPDFHHNSRNDKDKKKYSSEKSEKNDNHRSDPEKDNAILSSL